jgi:hypothetical protein
VTSTFARNPAWVEELLAEPPASVALELFGKKLAVEITSNVPVKRGILEEHWGSMEPRLTREGAFPKVELPIGSSLWHIIEWGNERYNVYNPPYAPIRRGADAAGLVIDMAVRSG